ncbi:MAG: RNA methyltransferase [Candidatus Sumerlaeota bacterium]|nr:RNA methyltransferase [Candidatus Sumerlaeota bacterium]
MTAAGANSTALFIALVHYPVVDKQGDVVTTSVTNLDVHDIARSARTYGAAGYYIVTPVPAMHWFVRRVLHFWSEGVGAEYNETRRDAFELIRLAENLDEAVADITARRGKRPLTVATSARPRPDMVAFRELREKIDRNSDDFLLILGTGWGLHSPLFARVDMTLEPIEPQSDYNHLSVRAAAAIMLDRLCGQKERRFQAGERP